MLSGVQQGAFFIGIASHYLILVVCGIPYWSQSSWQVSAGLYGRIPTFNGIWWECMAPIDGGFTCGNYGKPSIYLASDIQACRALMCIACIASFFGVIVALLGLECTTLVEPNTKGKHRLSMIAGVMFILAGVTCGAAVSWYAWRVTMEYFNPMYQEREFKYEYGACLYVGWVVMLLALIAGLVLLCGGCSAIKEEEEDRYPSYAYKPPTSKPPKSDNRTEYV